MTSKKPVALLQQVFYVMIKALFCVIFDNLNTTMLVQVDDIVLIDFYKRVYGQIIRIAENSTGETIVENYSGA